MANGDGDTSVLGSQREGTSYRILVEIAQRQPAVNQQEIADALDIPPQSVSDYLGTLTANGYVDKQARGRYEITNEGVDWLISRTEGLREFVEHVSGEVLEEVDVDAAIADGEIAEGDRVSLSMREGFLHAVPGEGGTATATAVTDADTGQDVGVTNFAGVIDYDFGTVTVVAVPPVHDGGSSVVDAERVHALATAHDLVAVDAPEGMVTARRADVVVDLQFGTTAAVRDAAVRGLDVLLLAERGGLATHTDALREHNVGYEVIDPVDER